MSFKLGDKVKQNNIKDPLIWKIAYVDPISYIFVLLRNHETGGISVYKIGLQELLSSYVKVDDEESQGDWFGSFYPNGLPKGKDEKKDEKYCNHDWKVYNGLNFSDEYCTKCNKKREIEQK